MSEPKRWSKSSSEIDPVLRSVVRYAQELEPNDAQLQRLLRATATTRQRRPRLRRFAVAVVVGMAATLGGVAWARYGARWLQSFQSPIVTPKNTAPSKVKPSVAAPAPPKARQAPSAAVTPAPSAVPAPSSAPSSAAPSGSGTTDSLASDAQLLQQARASVGTSPGLALALTREHGDRYPHSLLAEERQALRVEALSRLARNGEAQRALDAFETSFPRSPYRRRLRALVAH